jgi:hypothetical protein
MQENINKNEFKTDVINFARTATPLPVEVKQGTGDSNYVKWGTNNLYSNFLLELFHEVSLHNDIVSTKVNHIMGDGIVTRSNGKKAEYNINQVDSFEEVVRKVVFDYLIFNFYVLEVQYNPFGKPIAFNHIPAHWLRANKSKTKYWICDDWSAKKEVLTYDRWIKGKNEDRKSKIFMYSGYAPSVNNVYPMAAYSPAIENMKTEILIKNFNKNNIEDGFSPAHIISFFKGVPTADSSREFERKFSDDYTGASGKKYIISYNNPDAEKGVQVDTIGNTDYTAALTEVHNMNTESILTVHQATSRILFGIETAGSLGDKSAIESSYQIFKGLFVKDNRNVIEVGLNKLLSDAGFEEIEFKDKTNLFSQELESTTREKVLTIDELRALDGRPALPNGSGAVLLTTAAPSFTATATGSTANVFSSNVSATGRMLTGEDFELVKDLGLNRKEYSILSTSTGDFSKVELQFDDDKDVEDYLVKNRIDGKTLTEIKAAIRKDLGISITTGDLSKRIAALTEAKVIASEVVGGKVKISPIGPEKKRTIEVMYEYKVKEGYGESLIDTSRGFCIKLIDNDRLYTRSDIQQMSIIFGYDVFKHSGGWYFNPDKQVAENQCRHFWNQVRVMRKESK